eukprot:NODE_2000_length_1309_cov_23.835871_g1903_i0.p1 GENE.NODE_2000_length_1309_cov_23.835871_g1903_i0~~NODE_2000_length_1309_cov_23.835871_g1903_i0.p1  ORF type:complete len:345 (+),score=93.14 NODE_2000_length_1309_cov_23.835871_g1903_i0:34-1035(+)
MRFFRVFLAFMACATLTLLSYLIPFRPDRTKPDTLRTNQLTEARRELAAAYDRLKSAAVPTPARMHTPVLPSEAEIQEWERVALNFSRAGHMAKIGGELRPAYPIQLYKHALKRSSSVCPRSRRFGDKGDGGWVVCMTESIVNRQCVVYSFGVGADYSFEKSISPYCEVHSFDPTPHIVSMMHKLHVRWHFHPWGLDSYAHNGTFQMYTTGDRPVPARFEDIKSIMRLLGHTKVDVVKIDIEGYEVYVWHQLFEPELGIEQLLFELHPLTRAFTSPAEQMAHGINQTRFFDWTDWLVMLTACFRNGYLPFHMEEGRYNHAGGLQEFSFLRKYK